MDIFLNQLVVNNKLFWYSVKSFKCNIKKRLIWANGNIMINILNLMLSEINSDFLKDSKTNKLNEYYYRVRIIIMISMSWRRD